MKRLLFLLAFLPALAWGKPEDTLPVVAVNQLPPAAGASGQVYEVWDSKDGGCSNGGGKIYVICEAKDGVWKVRSITSAGGVLEIDVDPTATGTVTAGLREAFASCPINGTPGQSGVTGGPCKLRLRCGTTYNIGARSTWATGNPDSHANYLLTSGTSPTQATSDNTAVLDFSLYHNVTVEGCGASSVIEYNGATTNAFGYSYIFSSRNRDFLAPFTGAGSSGIHFKYFTVNWKEQCASNCFTLASTIFNFIAPVDMLVEGVTWYASQVAHLAGQPDTAPGGFSIVADLSQSPDSVPTNVRFSNNHITSAGTVGLSIQGCKNCVITNNTCDKLGMPVNDPRGGPTDSHCFTVSGGQAAIHGNTINIDYNGDTTAGGFRNYGIEIFSTQNGSGSLYRGTIGAISLTGNVFYGARREGDRELSFLGDSGVTATGNSFYGGECSTDASWSCRTDVDCSQAPGGSKGTCVGGGGAGIMWNLAYNGCPITSRHNIQGNSFFNFDQYDGAGGGDKSSMNCPIKIQGPFNTDATCPGYPVQDPNDVVDNIIANNLFVLTDPNKPGICGDIPTWASSRNTFFNNIVISYTGAQPTAGGAGTYQGIAGFGGGTTAIPMWKAAYSKTLGTLITDYDNRAKTSAYPLTDDDCRGTTFTNAGAGGQVNFTLPATRVGLHCKFYVRTAVATAIRLTPQSGTTIRPTSTTASQTITSDGTLGSYVEIEAQDSTTWVILGQRGTWTAP